MPKVKRMPVAPEFRVEFILSQDVLKDRRTNRTEQPLTILVLRGNEVLAARTLFSSGLEGFFTWGRGGDA